MNEETKYRVESADDEEDKEKTGFLRPLPEPTQKLRKKGKGGAITTLLGFEMYERNRDILVLLIIPLMSGLIDANIFGLIIIDSLPDSVIYIFVIPLIAAIPIGLIAGKTSHGIFGGILAGFFFVFWLMLFLITPALIDPTNLLGEFAVSGLVVSMIYFLFVVFASLLGSLIGSIAREFF
ncbi:MAG: hypothetical protein P1Q69_20750 [Candidatus Thorarchaeota archaeon]|nr:hypothetical protein [Candidatus Thorarchaeota archaeon]